MRRELVIGKWAAIIAALVAASACSPQCGPTARTPLTTTPLAAVPSPSPTPTAPLQPSSAPFHGGEVGVAYAAVSLSATGGVSPYKWSVGTGALPGGLTIAPDGSVSGTPTSAGTFTFTIQVVDGGDSTASLPETISIAPALTVGLISSCAQYCNVELGCASVCGAFGEQSGGVGPYTYTLTQGPLPSGTSLNGLSLDGTFTGRSGWLQFTVQVGDSLGGTALVSPRFWMYDHISLSAGTCTGRMSCKVTLSFAGGTPGPLPTLTATGWVGANVCAAVAPIACPEPTLNVSVQLGQANVVLVYMTPYSNTTGVLTVQINDNSLCSQGSHCTATASVQVIG